MRARQIAFWVLYAVFKPILIALFRLGFRIHVRGRDRVPRHGGLLLVSNHISYFDPPFLGLFTPRPVDWMAMEELFRNRALGALVRCLRCFPVNRQKGDSSAVREAVRRLREGHCVAIFPEGGIRDGDRSVVHGAGDLKEGAVTIARLAHVPVYPVLLHGTRAAYVPGNWFFRRPTITIEFGEPFYMEKHGPRSEAMETWRARIQQLAQVAR